MIEVSSSEEDPEENPEELPPEPVVDDLGLPEDDALRAIQEEVYVEIGRAHV